MPGTFLLHTLHGQRVADALEGVVDLLAKRGHDRDHDDGDERQDDRIFNQTLASLMKNEQHGSNSFLKKMD